MAKYTLQNIKDVQRIPGYWHRFVFRPIPRRVIWIIANYTSITPNQLTIISFLFGLSTAWCFLQGTYFYLVLGGILYQFSAILDCSDGSLARLKGLESRLGRHLDMVLDVASTFLITVCLVYGQYVLSGNITYFLLGFSYIGLSGLVIAFSSASKSLRLASGEKVWADSMSSHAKSSFIVRKLCQVKEFFDTKKLLFGPTRIDVDSLVFFVLPLLNRVKLGLIIGSALFLSVLAVRFLALLVVSHYTSRTD